MPLFMDVHEKLPAGTAAKDVASAHEADIKVQGKYGVKYLRYWVDDKAGTLFCLADAPRAQRVPNWRSPASPSPGTM